MSGWMRHAMDGPVQLLRDLAVDRSRGLLVVLGVLWGTLSLTVALSFGGELERSMERAMLASGRYHLRLWSGGTTRPHEGLPPGRSIVLVPDDAERIRIPGVKATVPEYITGWMPIGRGTESINARVHGVSAEYGELRSFVPEAGGRFLHERDVTERRRVAFLGNRVRDRLFGREPAVGAQVRIWGVPFTVVGVLRKRVALGNYEGYDDDRVVLPWTTFREVTGWRYVSYVLASLEDPSRHEEALRGIYRVLGARYGFDPEDVAAVTCYDKARTDAETRGILGGIRILTGAVGALGLLVALIGVVNVMYVAVEERRREVGIQMALGARAGRLLGGFLAEGIILTLAGGLAGIAASTAVLALYNRVPLGDSARGYLGFPAVSALSALGITAVLAVAGCSAGYFPARRAASLDPIEVLREE